MIETPQLRDTIENLYSVFEDYRLSAEPGACPCCHTAEEEQRLRVPPLRRLSGLDLRTYAMDALYTWGDEQDFKHFLPRICELLISREDYDFVDAEAVFRKLVYKSHWRSWPQPEASAIAKYFQALWDAAINSNPEDLGIGGADDWIEAIAQAEHDLSPYLNHWLMSPSVNAHRNLAITVTQFPFSKTPGGYWGDRREQFQQLSDWVRSPTVKDKLVRAVERWSDAPFGSELFDAAALL